MGHQSVSAQVVGADSASLQDVAKFLLSPRWLSNIKNQSGRHHNPACYPQRSASRFRSYRQGIAVMNRTALQRARKEFAKQRRKPRPIAYRCRSVLELADNGEKTSKEWQIRPVVCGYRPDPLPRSLAYWRKDSPGTGSPARRNRGESQWPKGAVGALDRFRNLRPDTRPLIKNEPNRSALWVNSCKA